MGASAPYPMLTLHAGPWVGEFGWELFGWQGFLRQMAPGYDSIRVYGPSGHKYLYSDFCTQYVEYDAPGKSPNMWMNDDWAYELPSHEPGDLWVRPQQLTLMANAPKQKFIQFGTPSNGYDILIHARKLTKYGSEFINLPDERWGEVTARCPNLRIACVGTERGALYVEGTDDLRGIELNELCDLMASSRLIIGPSSGPMHLAALCNLKAVVWSGYARSGKRYMTDWNPFKVPVRIIAPFGDPWGLKKPWQPSTEEIVEAIEAML